ncbi:hypothetical protein ACF073_29315 [Streptomyces sp. NPDC015171]|uniref:hypothetical protein n=1 Tax=Streptomyces sp. NPDC015171 TaxID=3364945 RepID=UPI0037015A2F
MKKRSMLAIATLATGFVVAAVTPSHGADKEPLGDPSVSSTLDTVDHLVSDGTLNVNENPLHENPLHGKPLHGKPLHGKPLHGKPLHGKPLHGK